jgi:ABC-type bacteriocin/lantibiotic exporter with double-glycine peptidase domain
MSYYSLTSFLKILSSNQKKIFIIIFFMSFTSSVMDVIGIGLIVPLVTLILDIDLFLNVLKKYSLIINVNIFNLKTDLIVSYFLILIGFFFFFRFCLHLLIGYYRTKLFWFFGASISSSLVSNYLSQKKSFFNQINSNTVIRNTIELPAVSVQIYLSNFYNLIFESIVIFLIFSSFLFINMKLTLLLLLVVSLFIFLFNIYYKKRIRILGLRIVEYSAERVKNFREALLGYREIKLANKVDFFKRSINQYNYRMADIATELTFKEVLSRYFFELLLVFLFLTSMYIFYLRGLNANELLPIISFFSLAILRMLPAINKILSAIQRLQQTSPAIEILKKEYDRFEYSKIKSDKILPFKKKINIKNLSFKYSNESNFIFKNLNIEIKKNSIFAILGKSGVGKTTFLNILCGFERQTGGKILIDNISIYENLEYWQSLLGYVPQDIFIKDSDIISNICLGLNKNEINYKNLDDAIKISRLKNLVALNKKEKIRLTGEAGKMLSGGQAQRIAIARALYLKPKILILDEPTKSLDLYTEDQIFKDLIKMKKFLTIIIVSHNLRVKNIADKFVQF